MYGHIVMAKVRIWPRIGCGGGGVRGGFADFCVFF